LVQTAKENSSVIAPALSPSATTTATSEAAVVRVNALSKQFRRSDGTVVPAVLNSTLDVFPGEFVVLLGPSGCGKTTLLRCVAGLERPDSGRIEIGGQVVYSSDAGVDMRPERRGLSMIFQSYALWPHMTVFKNVAYPLQCERPRLQRTQIAERVAAALETVGIGQLGDQFPNQLSGGQQQRVALARALVRRSDLILFDEPLSNVDAKVREQLRVELLAMQRQLGFAALYVTHDQAEAMQLANRVAVLDGGRIVQVASPRQVYNEPANRYIASFVGTSNEIEGVVKDIQDDMVIVGTQFGVFHGKAVSEAGVAVGDDVAVVWRPENTRVTGNRGRDDATSPSVNAIAGVVESVSFAGAHSELSVHCGATRFRSHGNDGDVAREGDEVWISADPARVRVLPI
jgi:iron(III) transport system ATP-binding protein